MAESNTKDHFDSRDNTRLYTTNIKLSNGMIAASQIVLVVEQHIPTWSSLHIEKSNPNRPDGPITPGRQAYQTDDCQRRPAYW